MRRPREQNAWDEYRLVLKYKDSEHFLENIQISGDLATALIYPNSYPVASSSLSFHELFRSFNKSSNISCERFFYERSFKRFFSLDSLKQLDEFRIWAFSIHYEIDVLNFVDILKNFKIPLRKEERDPYHPVIIVGGALSFAKHALLNRIADFVYRGDLEKSFIEKFWSLKSSFSREEIIGKLSRFEFSSPMINNNLSKSCFLSKYSSFSDRLLIEIGRGCNRKCRFCSVGYSFGKARFTLVEQLEAIIASFINVTRKIGFIASTVTDYPYLEQLLDLIEKYDIIPSFSSLRVDSLTESLLMALKKGGQNQFTIAPEGGSQRIRNLFSKGINSEHIDNALNLGIKAGFEAIKLYFIYGAPFEEEVDRKGIVQIAEQAKKKGYKKVIVSLNPLIPKPGTAYYNMPMTGMKELKKIAMTLRKNLNTIPGVKTVFESVKEGIIQYSIANLEQDSVENMIDILENGDDIDRHLLKYAEYINSLRKE
ncbi:MAG: radical SAM protein [Kosmotoga sp.]|nr:MAG: radical SAM protein [Kosmotoga sp.]